MTSVDIDGERRSFQIKRNIHTKAKRYEMLMCFLGKTSILAMCIWDRREKVQWAY